MNEKFAPIDNSTEARYLDVDNAGERHESSKEAIDAAVATVGSAFHEDWRKTRLNGDGSFEPRMKTTSDEAWIELHGTDQVDIANSDYENLPEDWKGENKAAAEVVVGIVDEYQGSVDLSDPKVRSLVGSRVHDAWLSRNDWARGGELDVPFDELPEDEQAKDVSQVEVALDLLT